MRSVVSFDTTGWVVHLLYVALLVVITLCTHHLLCSVRAQNAVVMMAVAAEECSLAMMLQRPFNAYHAQETASLQG
jgi:hypothetical protein